MGKKIQGECSICGEDKMLTYEHLPPKSARNAKPKRIKGHEEMFEHKSPKYGKSMRARQGFGKYCLCQECNNNTGAWYGKDYVDFVDQCERQFVEYQTLYRENEFIFTIKPLNVLKQIAAIFMSVNEGVLNSDEDEDLKSFVLDRYNKQFPERYRVFMYTTGSKNCRYCGLSGVLSNTGTVYCSEFVHRPFGFQLTLNSTSTEEMAEITGFSKFDYDQIVTMKIGTIMLDVLGPMPGNLLPIDFNLMGDE